MTLLKKIPLIRGPMQLKPVLFKDQLYMLCDLVKKKSQLKPPRLMVFQLGQPYSKQSTRAWQGIHRLK